MKNSKRMLALLLALLFVFSTFGLDPVNVRAADAQTTVISVESKWASVGSTVSVPVMITGNPGLLGASMELSYDEGLTLLSVEQGDAWSYMTMTNPGVFASPCNFLWDAQDVPADVVQDGTIMTLVFRIEEDVAANSALKVSLSYHEGDVFDGNMESVALTLNDGKITVIDYTPGDVNGDGTINARDVVFVRRYITGGYNVSITPAAADVNADGRINARDVVMIRRYITGGYGVELQPSPYFCNHNLEAFAAKDPTCTEAGNQAYWHCTICDRYFLNENAVTQVPMEDIVLPATRHTEEIIKGYPATATKPGLTDGKRCSVCGEILVPQVPIPIPDSPNKIVYHIAAEDHYLANVVIDNSKNPVNYDPDSPQDLIPLDATQYGYRFLGWFDLEQSDEVASYAQRSVSTPNRAVGEKHLYAWWTPITYTVTLTSDMQMDLTGDTVTTKDHITYTDKSLTVEEDYILPKPSLAKQDGYIFAGWSDAEGRIVSKLPQGTTGNQSFEANWVSKRNQAVPVKSLGDPLIYEDWATNRIFFTYEIGKVINVPVSVVKNFGHHNLGGISQSVSERVGNSAGTTEMDSYTNTVQDMTTNSFSWTLSHELSEATSVDRAWAEENGLIDEKEYEILQNEEHNWYVSEGSSGYDTTENLNTSDNYDLTTTTKNKHTYNTKDQQKRQDFSAELNGKYYSKAGATVPYKGVKLSAETGYEVNGNLKYSNGVTTDKKTGWEKDKTTQTQKGSISHTDTNFTHNEGWNSESGSGGSMSQQERQRTSKAISQMIRNSYNYGEEYIEKEGESQNQGIVSQNSVSNEHTASVSYMNTTTEEKEVSYTLNSNAPSGYYRLVMAGTAHVFAVVEYDIASANYSVNTLTVMDSAVAPFEDYSAADPNYDDHQTTVLPFEVPTDVVTYVSNRVYESDGLEISAKGIVTKFTGSDPDTTDENFVVSIPEYAVRDNQDGTKSVIPVVGIDKEAFQTAQGKQVTGIAVSDFVSTIPDGAFKDCTNLKDLDAFGVTEIGANAFDGCTAMQGLNIGEDVTKLGNHSVNGLDFLSVYAANKNIVTAAVNSGAKEITVGISDLCDSLDNSELVLPEGTDSFTFNGYGKTFNNLRIVSDAQKTVINRATFISAGKTPLEFSSPVVELNEVNVENSGIALALKAPNTALGLRGTVELTSSSGNTLLTKSLSMSQIDPSYYTELKVNGDVLICGAIGEGQDYLKRTGKLTPIDEPTFEQYIKGVINITLDAQGGTCEQDSMVAYYGTSLGKLPTPKKEGYSFAGWFTSDGVQVVQGHKFDGAEYEITLYAHWTENAWSGWTNSLPDDVNEDNYFIESKNQMRYRDKQKSTNSNVPGEYIGVEYGPWGNWSDWSRTEYQKSDTRDVQSRWIAPTYRTEYRYSRYNEYDLAATGRRGWNGPSKGNWDGHYCQYYQDTGWMTERYSVTRTESWGNVYNNNWYNEETRQVQTGGGYNEYRYRDRAKYYLYWADWTSWADATYSATDSRQVQSQTVYRYRMK